MNAFILQQVDIGNGVLVERGRLLAITQASNSATKLARNLFISLFKRDDVIGKSLTGRRSNAHLTTSEMKNALNPAKVNAVIGNVSLFILWSISHASTNVYTFLAIVKHQ